MTLVSHSWMAAAVASWGVNDTFAIRKLTHTHLHVCMLYHDLFVHVCTYTSIIAYMYRSMDSRLCVCVKEVLALHNFVVYTGIYVFCNTV